MKKKVVLFMTIAAICMCACTQKWQYQTVEVRGEEYNDYYQMYIPISDTLLNSMGEEGWELVSCYPIVETAYPDFGGSNLLIHIKSNSRTVAVRYVFRKKNGIL